MDDHLTTHLLTTHQQTKPLANPAARFDPKLRLGYKGTVAMMRKPDPGELLRQRDFLFFVLFSSARFEPVSCLAYKGSNGSKHIGWSGS